MLSIMYAFASFIVIRLRKGWTFRLVLSITPLADSVPPPERKSTGKMKIEPGDVLL